MNLRPYQSQVLDAVSDAFRSGRHAPLIVAPTGCLTGDTIIAYNHASKGGKMRLDEFVDRITGRSSGWDRSVPSFVRAPFPDGTVRLARVIDAFYSGMKRVYRLTLESGHSLVATREHKILTSKGYVEVQNLYPNHFVLVDGGIRKAEKYKPKSWYKLKRVPAHPYAARRGLKDKGSCYTVALHRLVAEAQLNGLRLDDYLKQVEERAAGLKFLDPKVWCVHHIDGNARNNDIANLKVMTHREHNAEHEYEFKKHLESKLIPSRVVAVELMPDRLPTYDLEIEGVHAFTANGIAVHNSGKTVIGIEAARRSIERGRRVVWLAHRTELIEQTLQVAQRAGIAAGIVSATHPSNWQAPLQICMMQTLLSREQRPDAELAIVDEAHHAVAAEWSLVVRHYPKRIGLTATPERADGRGLGIAFDSLHVAASIRELTDAGHLVPCNVIGPARALDSGQLAQHPVDAYREHCGDRPTIVFAPTIERAEEWAEQLQAVVVHSRMSAELRAAAISDFRAGLRRVLVNVNVLTEGFDAPETSACILARGCGSPGMYLQIVGRVLRPAPGKTDALLIDLRGVSHVHGAPDAEREYSLHGAGIRLKDDLKFCACCGTSITEYPCSTCGYSPADSDDKPVKITGEALRAIKFAAKRREDDEKRADYWQRVTQEARHKGYKRGWAIHRYVAVYGGPPTAEVMAIAARGRSAA